MNDEIKNVVAKLSIIREMAQNNEVKQLAKVMQDYIEKENKETPGFKSKNDNNNSSDK